MMFLYFVSLMIVSYIKRNIRNQMVEKQIENLPILPSKMKTKTLEPSMENMCMKKIGSGFGLNICALF